MSHDIKPLEPFGIEVIGQPDIIAIKKYLLKHKLLVIKNHTVKTKNDFIRFAEKLGTLMRWEFGVINELLPNKKATNYLYSHERVPFHWDGAFKTSPSLLLFHCIKAPKVDEGGETLFTNTNKILQTICASEKETWSKVNITYQTEKLAHYGGKITEALISKHQHTNEPILRFAEAVDTQLNPVSVTVSGLCERKSKSLIDKITAMIYNKSFCYQHPWQSNDLLIADNHALIHARRAICALSKRHIRRIQVI